MLDGFDISQNHFFHQIIEPNFFNPAKFLFGFSRITQLVHA